MTSPTDNVFDRLAELAYEAITTSGWSVDTNLMLTAADELLLTLQSAPDDEVTMRGRAFALAAMDWAVLAGDTTVLRARTRDFLASHLAAVEAAAA
jgi:hypothetical protein